LLAGLARPDIGIITNISAAHIQGFGSIENILKTKWELIDSLSHDGNAVLNADDDLLVRNFSKSKAGITTFGIKNQADVMAEDISLWPTTQFTLVFSGKRYRMQIPVMGLFNVYNALAAAAAAWKIGISPEKILKGLEEFAVPPMHMQIIRLSNTNVLINDAYNANPQSMRESVKAFVTMYAIKRKIVALGSMNELGDTTEAEHYALGEFLATQPIEKVYWFGKHGEIVKKGMADHFAAKNKVQVFESRSDLLSELIGELDESCAVLFKASRSNEFELLVEAVKEGYHPK
jgi:UDP-N-acetylmuramoyl-tripeptide--D-alanyl-D-alanine ligase